MQSPFLKPELLAPAGSEEALHAAVENGADAVYFGIAGKGNFNARVRAKNIPFEQLGSTVEFLHRRGVRAYLTLNTLVFDDELPIIETLLREFVTARIDAMLVQDLGIARLAHQLCPSLTLHASTQMSLTSAEALNLAKQFGIKRVVLPRELSIVQIRQLRRQTDLELEAFVHGALCISVSGQCLTSLALGGRSANRGCCAQPCRMSYTLIGNEYSETKQLFSPTDLAALPLLDKIFDAGVCAFKIEGRLKPPEYVAEVTRIYREAIDALCCKHADQDGIGQSVNQRVKSTSTLKVTSKSNKPDDNGDKTNASKIQDTAPDSQNMSSVSKNLTVSQTKNLERLALTFSRGFSTGWLEGLQPRILVPGNIMSHRGVHLGTVIEVRRDAVVVQLDAPVKRGDGVLFENEADPDRSQGGRVYEIFYRRASVKEANAGERVLLTFRNGTINADDVGVDQMVRKTDDPQLEREIRKTLQAHRIMRKVPLDVTVHATVGQPLVIDARTLTGATAHVTGDTPLEEAKKHPLTLDTLHEQLGRLGETIFELNTVDATLDGKAMVPLSVFGQLRKQMIAALEATPVDTLPPIQWGRSLDELRHATMIPPTKIVSSELQCGVVPHLLFRELRFFEDSVLLKRCIDAGCLSFYAELRGCKEYDIAAQAVRDAGGSFVTVTPRIMMPDETRFLEHLHQLQPNAVLVRNLGNLAFFQERHVPCIADFSFNVINDQAFWQLYESGKTLQRVTPGFDLTVDRLMPLLQRVPVSNIELIVQGRSPLFTMVHCLWKANLVPPRENCRQLCKTFSLKIRDRRGAVHTVRSDAHCRNIIENATPISEPNPDLLRDLVSIGVRHLRIEWDDRLGIDHPADAIKALRNL